MRKLKLLLALPLLLILTACASLGLQEPQSFQERLAYAVAQNAAVRLTAADALNAGKIELGDAKRVQSMADSVRTAIDAARVAADLGDLATAESRLVLAIGILNQLRLYLNEENSNGPSRQITSSGFAVQSADP